MIARSWCLLQPFVRSLSPSARNRIRLPAQICSSALTLHTPCPTTQAQSTDETLNSLSKKLGWILTGSAICAMSLVYGQIYLLSAVVPLVLFNAPDVLTISKTFKRDTTFLKRYAQYWAMSKRIQNRNLTMPNVFYELAAQYPNSTMLQIGDQPWKYKDVQRYANRATRLMQKYGLQKGDVVAVYCSSRPEMVALIVGMANLGITTALISAELRNEALIAAIGASMCRAIIFDEEQMQAICDASQSLKETFLFQMTHNTKRPEFIPLERELLKESSDNPEVFTKLSYTDPLMHIYSGDRSCKKPQSITHEKFLKDVYATILMLRLKSSDRIYNPIPLHDFNGMILGVGPSLMQPVTVVLRPEFSAKDYFRDCYVHNCTVAQYTGSMCKHLLLSPVNPIETFHPVRSMYGTGMDNDYWSEFVKRFHIPIFELLDSFTRDINMMNPEGKPGVVGFRPKIVPSALFPYYVIRIFGKEGIPVRNRDGSCQLCNYSMRKCGGLRVNYGMNVTDEPGLLVRMWDQQRPPPRETSIVENIFNEGDVAITQGDILAMDNDLNLRSVNKYEGRTWMAKQVTSDEVERLVLRLTNQKSVSYASANIHVLTIEDTKASLDIDKLANGLLDHLPTHSLPKYIRFVRKLATLGNGQINVDAVIKEELKAENNVIFRFDQITSKYHQFVWPINVRPEANEKLNANVLPSHGMKQLDTVNPPIALSSNKPWFTAIKETKERNDVVIVPLSRFKVAPLEPSLGETTNSNASSSTQPESKVKVVQSALETISTFTFTQAEPAKLDSNSIPVRFETKDATEKPIKKIPDTAPGNKSW